MNRFYDFHNIFLQWYVEKHVYDSEPENADFGWFPV